MASLRHSGGVTVPICKFSALVLGLTASSCLVFVTVTPCWYVTYADASISPYENCYGLWKYCSSTGLCGKWLSGSLLAPHGAQRTAGRGFMITACVLSGFALMLNIFGMKCVLLLQLSAGTKENLLLKSSLVWILAGSCSLAASTWYALDVMHLAWDKSTPIELSDGIFVGWGAAGFAYAAASLLWIAVTRSRRERKKATKRNSVMFAAIGPMVGRKCIEHGAQDPNRDVRLSTTYCDVKVPSSLPPKVYFDLPQKMTYM